MAAFAGSSRGFMAGCQAQELKAYFPHSLLPFDTPAFDTPADVSHYFACWSAQQTFTYYEVPRVHLDGIGEALSLGLDFLRVRTTPDGKKESCVSKQTRRTVAAAGLV
jgi:hypothetical protein